MFQSVKYLVVCTALLLALLSNAAHSDTSASAVATGFVAEQQFLPQLDQLQRKTAAEQKLLLLVLGAEWCHDSKALQQHFAEPALATALAKRFSIAFVDVGYLEFGQATAQRFQLPLYYGTPTVMIIAPDSGQLLNKSDLMQWTSAANFDAAAYKAYFIDTDFKQQFEQQQQQLAGISPAVLQQIGAFEQQQAATLAKGYQRLGPLLRSYKESGQAASAEFNQAWSTVKSFRTKILPQVAELQQQAKTLAPGEPLQLPSTEEISFSKN
jgi:thiol-disulfide isomerase/thioredoxin